MVIIIEPSSLILPHTSASTSPQNPNGKKGLVTDKFDRVFWFGDLNYRISGKKSLVEQLIHNSTFEVLVANDQLTKQKKEGAVFQGFEEGLLAFRPTYKYDSGTCTYDSSPKGLNTVFFEFPFADF